jgi:hypothetical protein
MFPSTSQSGQPVTSPQVIPSGNPIMILAPFSDIAPGVDLSPIATGYMPIVIMSNDNVEGHHLRRTQKEKEEKVVTFTKEIQIGVISFSYCGLPKIPGVYT